MRVVYIDFETYYKEKEYTLRNMSMEAYVRDPRFRVHMLGAAIDNGSIVVAPEFQVEDIIRDLRMDDPNTWTVAQNAKFDCFILSQRYGVHVRNPICTRAMARWTGVSRLTRESQAALCEFLGTGEKGTFLSNVSGKQPEDMTHSEWHQYVMYNKSDVRDLRANFLAMLPHMTDEAMEFIAMTTRMYTSPVLMLDKPLLEEYRAKLMAMQEESRQNLMHLFQFEDTDKFLKAIRAKGSFCKMLQQLGGEVPMKVSEKKTETAKKKLEMELECWNQTPDTDIDWDRVKTVRSILDSGGYTVMEPALAKSDVAFMELQNHPDPNIAALCRARAQNNSSIALSRTETFLAIAERGTLPVPLEPFLAWTGRYTGGTHIEQVQSDKVNLQNLSKRSGDKTLRHAITVPEGFMLVAGDSSQVEVRVGAYIAGQTDLLDAFRNREDPYISLAVGMYNRVKEELEYWCKGPGSEMKDDPRSQEAYEQRQVAKTFRLSAQYQAGVQKMGLTLLRAGIRFRGPNGEEDDEYHFNEVARLQKIYRTQNRALVNIWGTCENVVAHLHDGGCGYFGGPDGRLFYYDANHEVFGRKVPGVMFPNGYWLRYPNLRTEFDGKHNRFVYDAIDAGRIQKKSLYGGALFNNITQGTSFGMLIWQALEINKYAPVIMNAHDEWMSICFADHVSFVEDLYNSVLRMTPPWLEGVPLDCDVHVGRTYGQM